MKKWKYPDRQPVIEILTSQKELLTKCMLHSMNGTLYDLTQNNCQRWLLVLLSDGYDVNPKLLPRSIRDDMNLLTPLLGSASAVFLL